VSKIPKHETTKRKTKPQTQPTPVDPAAEYAASDYRHSSCIAEAIDGFASIFSTFVTQARDGDNGSSLYSSPGSYPVKVVLSSLDGEDEAYHSVELDLRRNGHFLRR
jgi:hypothetical protein